MKYCSKCGNEIKPGQKVCTNCGTPVAPIQNTQHVNHTAAPAPAPAPRKPMDKKTKAIIIGAIAALVLLFGIYKLIQGQYDPTSVANKVADAVKNKDAEKLSSLVTSGDEAIGKTEAKAFINYLYTNDEARTFMENIKTNTASMKQTDYPMTSVTDEDGDELMKIAQDGKAFGLFQKYAFNIPSHEVSVYANEISKLTYKLNGKEKTANLESGETVKLGNLPIGNYTIPATKEVEGKKFKGNLIVDMGTGMTAKEDFEYTYLHISPEGTYYLDDSEYKIFINGKEAKTGEDSYTVGPFEIGEEVEVQAKGTADDKEFESTTEKVTIEKTEDNMPQEVTVTFDEALISKYKEENYEKQAKKEEEQSERRSISLTSDEFIDGYTRAIHIDEFQDVKVGMTKDEVEDLLGDDSEYIDSSKENLKAYGNMGIEYDDEDKVKRILIVPDSYETWDLEDIEEFFGPPKHTAKNEDGDTVYYIDGTRGNKFVLVIVMENSDTIKYLTQKAEEDSDPWIK
ncbi:zinc-ribbon domain-containing protein [Macrococcoides canis]|uniref:TcaA second domain-containing protein n=1 Tax=Macrococcoides canis TaxID=1855823 RepID=UPI00207CFAE1|nr:zinc-ribbon domain-containing protein [Macrococcus canis]MCO4097644.1 zinc-ribbon domain-containing protein [Macrococcus canis]UTH10329.1 zinc-ribbon domain-containing protein [Macrococcus canis]